MLAPYTPCPGGFVTARELPDGRFLIEGWVLIQSTVHGDEPRHEPAYHWITDTEPDAASMVGEFVRDLAAPAATSAAPAKDTLVDVDDPYSDLVNTL
ncbi:hypothetical protein [Streptomyces sp. SID4982]|uniref:hypothetical protein n=1 Tax=Streptomyces sp. SID4982 TaxID=2690291 RepID=UPI0013692171|nr:hypothetical protein [Streptomyces sp. SID4982]MYS16131.1 hypothetical protein [Streptomyces sp. SID4982]